jgi:hypothetical protein
MEVSMKNSKDKRDDRDWVPVSDIDEEMDLPIILVRNAKAIRDVKPVKSPEKTLGYR